MGLAVAVAAHLVPTARKDAATVPNLNAHADRPLNSFMKLKSVIKLSDRQYLTKSSVRPAHHCVSI